MSIEEIEHNFRLVKGSRINASFALRTVKTSNLCISLFNHTKEGNIFNICRQSVYMRCIVEVRKILEPASSDKKANLYFIINQVYQNREIFAQKHYDDDLNMPTNWFNDEPAEYEFGYKERRESRAENEKQHCIETIELVYNRWNKLWKLLGESEAFSFIRTARDHLVHSMSATDIYMPPMNKVQKLLNIILWFIRKLDYIINNSSSNYKNLDNEAETIAEQFWEHMN